MKRKKLLVVGVILALVLPVAGYAAWNYFSGGSGTASGQLGTATRADAVTFTAPGTLSGSLVKASPGGTGDLQTIVGNSSGVDETITGISGVFSATPASCSQYLSLVPSAFTSLPTVPPAGLSNIIIPNSYSLDAATPVACSAATFSVQLTATTSP